jgi:hypothetical protein
MSNQFSTLKNTIKEFLKLDEEIRSLAKARLERVKLKDKLSKEIMNYYKLNNINTLDVTNDVMKQKLELVESERHPSVNKKFLRVALEKYVNNDKVVSEMIDYILAERNNVSTVSYKLKRIIPDKKKSSSSSSSIDAMSLIKQSDADKIKDRFAKLAEFAIIKDGIEPLNNINKNKPTDNIIISTPIQNTNKQINIAENETKTKPDTIKEKEVVKKIQEEEVEEEFEEEVEEEEVDLDDIPEEDTGYTEDPPQVGIEIKKENTIRNIISNRLDENTNTNVKVIGAIPVPVSVSIQKLQPQSQPTLRNDNNETKKEIENKALESWKILTGYSTKIPNLHKWLLIQQEKIKCIKSKEQFNSEKYNLLMSSLNSKEKELDNATKYNNEINSLRHNISQYIQFNYKK